MPKISTKANGKIIVRDGKASCICCQQLVVIYSWAGTDQWDLDTNTVFLNDSFGFACAKTGKYSEWVTSDNVLQNGEERVNIRVDDARVDGEWTSSVNIYCKAGWFIQDEETDHENGSGPANLIVKYRGQTKSKFISPGAQSNCASTAVGTITVYAEALGDGSHFQIS